MWRAYYFEIHQERPRRNPQRTREALENIETTMFHQRRTETMHDMAAWLKTTKAERTDVKGEI